MPRHTVPHRLKVWTNFLIHCFFFFVHCRLIIITEHIKTLKKHKWNETFMFIWNKHKCVNKAKYVLYFRFFGSDDLILSVSFMR